MRTTSAIRAIVLAIMLATAVPTMALAHDRGDDEHGQYTDRHDSHEVGDRRDHSDDGDHGDGGGVDHHQQGEDGDHHDGDHHDGDHYDAGSSSGPSQLSDPGPSTPSTGSGTGGSSGGGQGSSHTGSGGGAGDSSAAGHDNRITICHVEFGMVWPRKTGDPKAQYLPHARPADLSTDFLPDPVLGCGPTLG